MLFSRAWLAEHVALPGEVSELARRLTMAGLAVEGLEERGGDALLDVDVTTNRPDCMCHRGLAREAAVLFDRELTPLAAGLDEAAEAVSAAAAVEVEDPAGCPRYVARLIRGVRIGPSPPWLAARLEAIGLRPVNNAVDATNYVLWELGQPLHAFDLATLAGRTIVVRRARAGEELTTLDGERRALDPEVLVIADAERPVALAGVIGGSDTEVTGATGEILLESAHFDPLRVRRGSKRFGLHTDASHRFERGADPEICRRAADRAAALIAELAGGRVLAGALEVGEGVGDAARGRIESARLDGFAGAAVPPAEVERILEGLGFAPDRLGEAAWEVTVPSWRRYDIGRRPDGTADPADLYEEVLRVWGFDRVPSALPSIPGPDAGESRGQQGRDRIRRQLAACGYSEAINYAFHASGADRGFPALRPGTPVGLENPLSELYSVLRRSLLPGLAATAVYNARRGAEGVRFFELGRVFFAGGAERPEEIDAVALVAGGAIGDPWDGRVEFDVFHLKGAVETLCGAAGLAVAAHPAEVPGLVAGTAAELRAGENGEPLGYLGRLEAADLPFPLYAAELEARAFLLPAAPSAVELPSRFPGVRADLTLTHPEDVPWSAIEGAIRELRPPELAGFTLKDRYRGEGVPAGAVNTTIAFQYAASDRSLTQDEVNARQQALARELAARFATTPPGSQEDRS